MNARALRIEINLAERRPTPAELVVLRLLARQPCVPEAAELRPGSVRRTREIRRVSRSGRGVTLSASTVEIPNVPAWILRGPDGRARGLRIPVNPANLRIGTLVARLPKVLLVPIAQDQLFQTDGTTVYVATLFEEFSAVWTCLGRQVRAIRVHWSGEAFTANFKTRVVISWSVLGQVWSSPIVILPEQTGNGQTISAPFADSAELGILERVAIEVANVAGAAIESGRITAVLELELRS